MAAIFAAPFWGAFKQKSQQDSPTFFLKEKQIKHNNEGLNSKTPIRQYYVIIAIGVVVAGA